MAVVACYHLRTQGLETMAHRKCYHESNSKPLLEEVYVGKHLSFCQGGKAVRGNAMVANRTREIRPSGMKRGACGNVGYGGG